MQAIPRLVRWIVSMAVFFLVFMSLLRLGTYAVFNTGHAAFRDSLPAFWLGFRYDARVVGVVSVIILLLGSIRGLHPFRSSTGRKTWLAFTGLFAVVLIILYVLDFLHYRYLSQRLNASALSFLEDATISAGMVWQTYPVLRILAGIVIGALVVFWIIRQLYTRAGNFPAARGKASGWLWSVACFLCCGLAIFGKAGQYPLRWSDAYNLGNDFNANLALNPFQSFFSSLSFRTTTYSREKVKQYYPLMAGYLGVTQPDLAALRFSRNIPAAVSATPVKPNIVLVICESFSGYKSSMWGNPLNTTPFFNQLCSQGIFFDNYFTPHYGTARGVWATITGIPDVEKVKTASRNPAMVDQHTIINNFEGYEKFYFLGGSTSWANIRGLITNNISNLHLYEEDSYDAPKIDVWGISDKNLFLQANKVLQQQRQPFFAIIQTADNHRPYTIPEEDRQEFKTVTVPEDSIKKYGFESNAELNAFRYTDFGYRKFMEAARASPYFANTIFVFTGDHGINGNVGDMFPASWTDNGLSSYHVPLLFYAPGLLPAQRLHNVASQVDVLPTIAGLAGVNYTNTTLGRDLMKTVQQDSGRSNAAFVIDYNNNNIGIVKGDYYYTRQPAGREEMVWANFRKKQQSPAGDSLTKAYRELSSAMYETARYMLLTNKK